MDQGPWAWFVARLDGFLSEPLRQGTPCELGRARLLAGVSLGLLVCDVLLLLQVLLGGGPRSILLMGGVCAVGFGGALVLLRRASSTRTLALLLCSLVTVGMINSSLQSRSLVVATHASVMLLPVLSVYLLGWRMGLLFSVVVSVNVGLVFPLHAWGTLAGPDQALCVFAALSVLCAWAVSGLFITARKESEVRLSEMHRILVDASRQAGMAEIATTLLHNVSNTLKSVNASVERMTEWMHGLRVVGLSRAVALLDEHAADLGGFLTTDSRGRLLPEYLKALAQAFTEDRERGLTAMRTLAEHVAYIDDVVNMRARDTSSTWMVKERVPVPELLDEALHMLARSFEQAGIEPRLEYVPVPPPWVYRPSLLQILINLLNNACQALEASERPDKQLTLRVGPGEAGRLRIEVADNGVGIAPEHLPRLFSQGFTTKKNGHGFGLYTSALTVKKMDGSISCTSAGAGQGATFIVELPLGSEPLASESNEDRPGLGTRDAPVGTET